MLRFILTYAQIFTLIFILYQTCSARPLHQPLSSYSMLKPYHAQIHSLSPIVAYGNPKVFNESWKKRGKAAKKPHKYCRLSVGG